jgi:epoxyqueuosine reductase QueG
MGLSRVMDLVSQAEREGTSLGVLISHEMTEDEMAEAQQELRAALDENYTSIESFMADVEVPSLEDALSRNESSPGPVMNALSDEASTEG